MTKITHLIPMEDELNRKVRNVVLAFVKQKQGVPGWYHDGAIGTRSPSREVTISKENDTVKACYCCGGQMWHFTFSPTELNQQHL